MVDAPPASDAARARPLVGVTMGDPCGIGAEVLVKALADPALRGLGRFIVYGVDDVLQRAARRAGIRPYWFCVPVEETGRIDSGVVVADFEDYAESSWSAAASSAPTAEGGRMSLRFLEEAIGAAREGAVDAIVTGPIHKTSWKMAGCRFPGHTEMLADAFRVKRVTMMFVAGDLRVALASAHVGLFDLRNRFTIGLVFQPVDLLNDALRHWFGIEHPRIGVAALNPHGGEEGRFGDEETRVIEPALQMARNAGIDVEGPFPADTLFTSKRRERYDGIVTMYHDQGLIPVKLLAFNRAVNMTLGLPIIRTSVDHGTALDIAGTNQADAGSMKEAIRLACRLAAVGRMPLRPRLAAPAPTGDRAT